MPHVTIPIRTFHLHVAAQRACYKTALGLTDFMSLKSYRVAVLAITALSFLLQGCASSSGVVQTGPNTYMIARSKKGFRGSSGPVKAKALEDAQKFCARNGKVMKVISASQKDMVPFTSDAQAEVHFMALAPNDPALKTPVDTGSLKTRVFRGDEKTQSINVEVENRQVDARPKDVYAEIQKLGELKKNGLITDEEFEKEKQKLLDAPR